MKKSIYGVVFGCVAALIASTALYAAVPEFPDDKKVEKDMRSNWSAEAEVLSLQKNPKRSEWRTQVVVEDGAKITRASIGYIFKDKTGETVKTDKVTVTYELNDGNWWFKGMGFTGETDETVYEVRPGVTAPEKDEIKKMIKETIEANKSFDFSSDKFKGVALPLKVDKVLIAQPRYKDHKSKFFFEYLFDFEAVDKKGKPLKVTDMWFVITKSSVSDAEWTPSIRRSFLETITR